LSKEYHRYKDNIKLRNVTNNAKYLLVVLSLDLDLVKKINNPPITGSKINDDKIGKSIILKLKKLIEQKNQLT